MSHRSRAALAVALSLVGRSRAAAQLADPAQVGQWSKTLSWPSQTHAHLLPTGEVMFNGEFEHGDEFFLWNPATATPTPSPNVGYNSFCGGHSFLADGTLLVTGGHVVPHLGFAYASLFDPATKKWTRVPDMNDRRWYPTTTTLANGDALVIAGELKGTTGNALPQVLDTQTRTWRSLTTALKELRFYPREFVAPNGKVFVAGTDPETLYLDTAGTGAWTPVAPTTYGGVRDYGPAVMYEPGKVLYAGGGDPPTATAEVIDLNAATPSWRAVAPMSAPRRQNNGTLLPDGRVLVTGGSSGPGNNDKTKPVFATEVWDPATEKWTQWAPMSAYRGYHSTALLLPDGRVLSGGGAGDADYTMELFSPPYLFHGARPTITSAPAAIDLSQPFAVGTPDAANIAKVSLVRLGSVTHSFNQNQRFTWLTFTAESSTLTVNAPQNNALAPAGHYMLFLVDRSGVPSVASILKLSTQTYAGPSPSPPPTPPPSPSAPPESPPTASAPPQAAPPVASEPITGSPATTAPSSPNTDAPAVATATTRPASRGGCSSAPGFLMVAALGISLWLTRQPWRRRER